MTKKSPVAPRHFTSDFSSFCIENIFFNAISSTTPVQIFIYFADEKFSKASILCSRTDGLNGFFQFCPIFGFKVKMKSYLVYSADLL